MRWKALDWIDPRYEVSDSGVVRSWANSHGGVSKQPRVLKAHTLSNGYLDVRLVCNSTAKHFLVHRLVLQAFSTNVGAQVNHKNGVKTDNRLVNLEWSNASHNAAHAYRRLGRRNPRAMLGRRGKDNPHSVGVVQLSLDEKVVKVWDAIADASRHGFGAGNIWAVCAGRRKTHGGFKWRYL